MPLRATFALAASLAVVGSAVAKEAQIGSATLTLPSPAGYCELIDTEPSDARVIKEVGNLVAGAQNELLSMMADCSQLEAWRVARLSALDDYVQYQTPMGTKDSNVTRAASVKGFCANMRTEGEKRIPGVVPDLNARAEKAYKGAKINQASFLGVLAEDDDACYYGLLLQLRTELGDEKTQVTIAATTVVKGKVVYYNLYTVYREGENTVTAALERHRRNLPALLVANGDLFDSGAVAKFDSGSVAKTDGHGGSRYAGRPAPVKEDLVKEGLVKEAAVRDVVVKDAAVKQQTVPHSTSLHCHFPRKRGIH